jgi:hypothetical protein
MYSQPLSLSNSSPILLLQHFSNRDDSELHENIKK